MYICLPSPICWLTASVLILWKNTQCKYSSLCRQISAMWESFYSQLLLKVCCSWRMDKQQQDHCGFQREASGSLHLQRLQSNLINPQKISRTAWDLWKASSNGVTLHFVCSISRSNNCSWKQNIILSKQAEPEETKEPHFSTACEGHILNTAQKSAFTC